MTSFLSTRATSRSLYAVVTVRRFEVCCPTNDTEKALHILFEAKAGRANKTPESQSVRILKYVWAASLLSDLTSVGGAVSLCCTSLRSICLSEVGQ